MTGATPKGVGPSQAEPVPVSSLRASVPSADDFIRSALTNEIATMLDELGNPALVERIYPNGWRNADRMGLVSLYELCRRTFVKRGTGK